MPDIAGTGEMNSQDGGSHKSIVVEYDSGTTTILPEGTDLASSSFSREGQDLLIRTPDGTDVLITRYFASSTPPHP